MFITKIPSSKVFQNHMTKRCKWLGVKWFAFIPWYVVILTDHPKNFESFKYLWTIYVEPAGFIAGSEHANNLNGFARILQSSTELGCRIGLYWNHRFMWSNWESSLVFYLWC